MLAVTYWSCMSHLPSLTGRIGSATAIEKKYCNGCNLQVSGQGSFRDYNFIQCESCDMTLCKSCYMLMNRYESLVTNYACPLFKTEVDYC